MIFVMSEEKEKQMSFIKQNFDLKDTPIHDLDIPDIYHTHQKELKEELIKKVLEYLDLKTCLNNLIDALGH